eukprot:TRINITY_DN544_c0_g1_i3.p1 TRINITY_DN544_c0_g1~~TRINITY_DN544_c0_g1_i3.p1  ORF type:complete len:155 (+),score=40.92 TRINITY_DN544_c0_g1_i3:67-531(+)
MIFCFFFFFFQAEDGIRDVERSRGLGDVYKRQTQSTWGFDPTYYGDFLYRMTYTVCRDVENIQSLLGSFRFLAICSSMIFHRVFDCSKGEVQDFNTKMFQLIEKDEKLMKWIIANKNELQIYMKQLCVHWTNKDYGLAGVAMGSAIKMIKKFLQ